MQRDQEPSSSTPESAIESATSAFPAHTVFLTGPTASGKTHLAVEVAERIGAEIISLDSMAVYRQMDIGTAKPSIDDRNRVPHHLMDVVDVWQEFSLAEYQVAASTSVRDVVSRGRVPLFVGGTPLYLKALLRGVNSGPPPNPALRSQLALQIAEHGSQSLHEQLERVDPAAARRIHFQDARRIIRAIEVFQTTGIPISVHQVHFHAAANSDARVFCLDIPRAELYRRINERVVSMFQRGLVEEVRGLMELPRPLSRTASQAVGYKEVIAHLAGEQSLATTIELVQRRSRQFAKRQLTWFRGIRECRWLAVQAQGHAAALADTFITALGRDSKCCMQLPANDSCG